MTTFSCMLHQDILGRPTSNHFSSCEGQQGNRSGNCAICSHPAASKKKGTPAAPLVSTASKCSTPEGPASQPSLANSTPRLGFGDGGFGFPTDPSFHGFHFPNPKRLSGCAAVLAHGNSKGLGTVTKFVLNRSRQNPCQENTMHKPYSDFTGKPVATP